MSDDTAGMYAAEAADPGFVFRHGWCHLRCPDCREIIYDGRSIGSEGIAELRQFHRIACTAGGSKS